MSAVGEEMTRQRDDRMIEMQNFSVFMFILICARDQTVLFPKITKGAKGN